MKDIIKLVIAIVVCELVGVVAAPVTISAIPAWYQTLNKPFFSPPSFVFGPIWIILYFLMGVALYLVWKEDTEKKKVIEALRYFFIQLFFNFIWSILFFGLRLPILGLIDIVVLWISIVITMSKFRPLSPLAFYLLTPYIVWVSFAVILNLSIILLNPI